MTKKKENLLKFFLSHFQKRVNLNNIDFQKLPSPDFFFYKKRENISSFAGGRVMWKLHFHVWITTHSAVVQVWENHRTVFVAHCSKAEDHLKTKPGSMKKKEFFFCIMSRLPSSFTIKKSDQPLGNVLFYLIVMGVLKLIHQSF